MGWEGRFGLGYKADYCKVGDDEKYRKCDDSGIIARDGRRNINQDL